MELLLLSCRKAWPFHDSPFVTTNAWAFSRHSCTPRTIRNLGNALLISYTQYLKSPSHCYQCLHVVAIWTHLSYHFRNIIPSQPGFFSYFLPIGLPGMPGGLQGLRLLMILLVFFETTLMMVGFNRHMAANLF